MVDIENLQPETLKAVTAAVSSMAHALELAPQPLVPARTFSALAACNHSALSVPQVVLSDSARQVMMRSVATAAEIAELSKSTTALRTAVLKNYEPTRTMLLGLQDSLAQFYKQTMPDETLKSIASALASIAIPTSTGVATAVTQTAAKRSAASGSYDQVARQLVENLGIAKGQELPSQPFEADATASPTPYDIVSEAAPEVAAQIDEAADQVKTSFLHKKQVRYSLAALVLALISVAWIVTGPDIDLIPQPWRGVLRSAAESIAVGVPATRMIARKPDKSSSNQRPGMATNALESR